MTRYRIEDKNFEDEYRRKGAYHLKPAAGFQRWFLDRNYRLLRAFLPARGRILDIGCGEGRLADYVPRLDYVGVDLSNTALTYARERLPRATLIEASMEEVARHVEARSFDGVVCSLSLMYLSREAFLNTVRAVRETLKPGAPFVFSYINCAHALHGRLLARLDDNAREVLPLEDVIGTLRSGGLRVHRMVGTNLPLDLTRWPRWLHPVAFTAAALLGYYLPWRAYHVVFMARAH